MSSKEISLYFNPSRFLENITSAIPLCHYGSSGETTFIYTTGDVPELTKIHDEGLKLIKWSQHDDPQKDGLCKSKLTQWLCSFLQDDGIDSQRYLDLLSDRSIPVLILCYFSAQAYSDLTVYDYDLPEPTIEDGLFTELLIKVVAQTGVTIYAPGTKYLHYVAAKSENIVSIDEPLFADDSIGINNALDKIILDLEQVESSNAYITLTSAGYEWGTIVLLNSLYRYNHSPTVVLTSKGADVDLIRKNVDSQHPIHFVQIPNLQFFRDKRAADRYSNTLGKVFSLGISKFDRIVFLDGDMLVRARIEELFEGDPSEIYATSVFERSISRKIIQSSIFSLAPSRALFEKFVKKAVQNEKYNGQGDHGYFIDFFRSDWKEIPDQFSYNWSHQFREVRKISSGGPKVVHFHGFKPWERVVGRGVYLTHSQFVSEWYGVLEKEQLVKLILDMRTSEARRERDNIVRRYLLATREKV